MVIAATLLIDFYSLNSEKINKYCKRNRCAMRSLTIAWMPNMHLLWVSAVRLLFDLVTISNISYYILAAIQCLHFSQNFEADRKMPCRYLACKYKKKKKIYWATITITTTNTICTIARDYYFWSCLCCLLPSAFLFPNAICIFCILRATITAAMAIATTNVISHSVCRLANARENNNNSSNSNEMTWPSNRSFECNENAPVSQMICAIDFSMTNKRHSQMCFACFFFCFSSSLDICKCVMHSPVTYSLLRIHIT